MKRKLYDSLMHWKTTENEIEGLPVYMTMLQKICQPLIDWRLAYYVFDIFRISKLLRSRSYMTFLFSQNTTLFLF